ncbi:unnamed protein product, partial [Candidula unifasciata]
RPVCGRRQVIVTNVKRGTNRNNDNQYDTDEQTNEASLLNKILGGNYATYGQFPWMAAVLDNNQHTCGGAIISEFWVISAAHCF